MSIFFFLRYCGWKDGPLVPGAGQYYAAVLPTCRDASLTRLSIMAVLYYISVYIYLYIIRDSYNAIPTGEHHSTMLYNELRDLSPQHVTAKDN